MDTRIKSLLLAVCIILGCCNDKGKLDGILLKYKIDSQPGQSGAPVIYQASDGKYYVVGIHKGGYGGYNNNYYNCARYITKRIYKLVNKYK